MKPAQTCRGRMGLAVLALGLGAGCAAPRAQFTDADWVSHSATGRGCYERGDFRRGADAYGRAEQRAQALDDADALAVAAVNRAVCLLAIGQAEPALQGANEALADARVAPGRQAELQVAAARAEVALGRFAPAQARLAAVLKSNPSPALRAQALLAQSAAELALGNPAGAGEILEKGLSAGAWAGLPPLLRAEHAVRLGEIAVWKSSRRKPPPGRMKPRPCGNRPAGCRKWRAPWPRAAARPRQPAIGPGPATGSTAPPAASGRRASNRMPYASWKKVLNARNNLMMRMLGKNWRPCL